MGRYGFRLVEDWSELYLDGQSVHFASPVVFTGRVTATGEVFLVRGTVATDIETTCARCPSPVRVSIKADVDERFRMASHAGGTGSASDREDENDDWRQEDVQEFRGLTIQLDDVVLGESAGFAADQGPLPGRLSGSLPPMRQRPKCGRMRLYHR